jgi:thiamine kinase-like enzyme
MLLDRQIWRASFQAVQAMNEATSPLKKEIEQVLWRAYERERELVSRYQKEVQKESVRAAERGSGVNFFEALQRVGIQRTDAEKEKGVLESAESYSREGLQSRASAFLQSSEAVERYVGGPVTSIEFVDQNFASNRNFVQKVVVNGHSLLVKQNFEEENRLAVEADAYRAIGEREWAPELVDSADGMIAVEFLEETSELSVDSATVRDMESIADMLGDLSVLDREEAPEKGRAALTEAVQKMRIEYGSMHNLLKYMFDREAVLQGYSKLERKGKESVGAIHTIHGDLAISNLLKGLGRLCATDFENVRQGDCAFDLARFYRDLFDYVAENPGDETVPHVQQLSGRLIDRYIERTGDTEVAERLRLWAAVRIMNGGNHFESVRVKLSNLCEETMYLTADSTKSYFQRNHDRIMTAAKGVGGLYHESEVDQAIEEILASNGGEREIKRYQELLDRRIEKATEAAARSAVIAEQIIRTDSLDEAFAAVQEFARRAVRVPECT